MPNISPIVMKGAIVSVDPNVGLPPPPKPRPPAPPPVPDPIKGWHDTSPLTAAEQAMLRAQRPLHAVPRPDRRAVPLAVRCGPASRELHRLRALPVGTSGSAW